MSVLSNRTPQTDRIIDIGAGKSPDPRATETADVAPTADHQFDVTDPWPLQDNSVRGLIARHVLEHVAVDDYAHVFREAARVLTSDGWFEVRVPLGADFETDPTHTTQWRWRTPELLVDDDCHWVPTAPFRVAEKELDAWGCGPLWPATPLLRAGSRRWPCELWADIPGATGELTVRFEVNR